MYGLKFRGRPPIHLAESVKDVINLENPYSQIIMDMSKEITEDFVDAILAQSVFAWEGRNPSPALDEEGNFVGTDLDLFSFLMPMADRGAVIEIPHYRNRRKVVVRKGERKIGTNQFGNVTGLISHKDVHSFSVRIFDRTIVKKDPNTNKESLGANRNYMLVDCDGFWYPGWDRVCWDPTAEENKFLAEKKLWTGNTVYFKNYVHPNRWQSIFGAPYLLLKMLSERLSAEAAFCRSEIKRFDKDWGLAAPKMPSEPPEYEGKTESIKVDALEMQIDMPNFNENKPLAPTQDVLIIEEAYRKANFLTYTLKPKVQFMIRADETAYLLFGRGRVAHWMGNRKWNTWKAPRGRISWNQMVLSNDVALRYRVHEVTQQVSAE